METDFLGIHEAIWTRRRWRRTPEGAAKIQVADASDLIPNLLVHLFQTLSFIRNFNSAVAFLEQVCLPCSHSCCTRMLKRRSQETVSDEHSSSRFQPVSAIDAFEANQRCFSFDIWRGMNQYPFHAYQPQNTDFVDSSQHKLNHFSPVNMSSPLFKTVGALNGPNIAVTSAKQQPFGCGTTISTPCCFCSKGNCINVYDNVPLDKAQAIMLLASKISTVTSNAMNSRFEAPLLAAASVPTEVVE
ncbi:protein complementing XP-C cells [Musa troglodytarum]|uniref:Protein complementing XP-C cells n=1 Tax=Musa troglodytarum TaxID=320322 RepID=A0A9E7KJ38_9LILI|nr:protein complementing XP-C cells [Musa troglodytarum]